MHDKVYGWLAAFAAQSERSRDDLHVDQINAAFKDRQTWADAGMQCFTSAVRVARAEKMPITVAMEFFLESTEAPEGFAGGRLQDMAFSWTPPALTVYHKGTEPWIGGTGFEPVATLAGLPYKDGVTALFQEWFDESEGDYDRRLWLIAE